MLGIPGFHTGFFEGTLKTLVKRETNVNTSVSHGNWFQETPGVLWFVWASLHFACFSSFVFLNEIRPLANVKYLTADVSAQELTTLSCESAPKAPGPSTHAYGGGPCALQPAPAPGPLDPERCQVHGHHGQKPWPAPCRFPLMLLLAQPLGLVSFSL